MFLLPAYFHFSMSVIGLTAVVFVVVFLMHEHELAHNLWPTDSSWGRKTPLAPRQSICTAFPFKVEHFYQSIIVTLGK